MKNKIINEIIRVEGGYVDDPSDSGGETNFGITVAVARANGYNGRMIDMPRQVAFDIYAFKYWDKVKGDDLALISHDLAEEVVDTGVNMGTGRASKFLQRALNAMNKRGTLYCDIAADGQVGGQTITALKQYAKRRDVKTLVKMLNCMQGAFYINLAERREKDERFINGWFKNRVK